MLSLAVRLNINLQTPVEHSGSTGFFYWMCSEANISEFLAVAKVFIA
jgi:hypothetical protein